MEIIIFHSWPTLLVKYLFSYHSMKINPVFIERSWTSSMYCTSYIEEIHINYTWTIKIKMEINMISAPWGLTQSLPIEQTGCKSAILTFNLLIMIVKHLLHFKFLSIYLKFGRLKYRLSGKQLGTWPDAELLILGKLIEI